MLDEVPIPTPEPGEVLVRVQAIPLNLNDLERITGGNMMVRPELPYSPGMEVMGVVDATRRGRRRVDGQARRRDAEAGATAASPSTRSAPAVSTFEMPDDIPLPDAAALYFPFHLAWLGLFDRAELQAGESVLIHAAAGGSGSAAIQLAKHAGARVFATAGTDEKVAALPRTRRRRRHQLHRRRFRGGRARSDRQPRRRRRVRQRRRSRDGRVDELHRVQRPLPDDGLRIQQGSGRREVRRARGGSRSATSSCAACCSPTPQPDMADMVKSAMGWNFASGRARRPDHAARSSNWCAPVRSRRSSATSSHSTTCPPRSKPWRTGPPVGRTIVRVADSFEA